MNFNDLSVVLEYIKNIFDKDNFDVMILAFNFFIALIFLILYYDIKIKDIVKERKFMLLLVLVWLVDFIMECVFGNIIAILPVISFFVIHIAFMLKNKELFKQFESLSKKKKKKGIGDKNGFSFEEEEDVFELNYKVNKLGKNTNFNIIDILYLYDYITDYQRRKVIQELIYDDVSTMAERLNTIPAVNDDELREATAILNVINLEGKLLTKEEALLHIMDISGKNKTSCTTSTSKE